MREMASTRGPFGDALKIQRHAYKQLKAHEMHTIMVLFSFQQLDQYKQLKIRNTIGYSWSLYTVLWLFER